MKEAIKEARKAYKKDEVPVGAVIVKDGAMCTGAMIQARLKKVVIGTMDEKTGACGSVLNLLEDYKFNHVVEIEKGVMETECKKILQQFFKELREKKKK